tara:strand:+ start:483 stop:866 length:384 start_codon:yes stop_codon:yes gene_type:complete
MKKITISVALLLGGYVAKSQTTEYIDVTTKNIFGRSEMVIYNNNTNHADLEYLYLSRFNNNYHWVKYTGAKDVIVSLNDGKGDKRRICTQQGQDQAECKQYDAFGTQYKFTANQNEFQIWISRPNVK